METKLSAPVPTTGFRIWPCELCPEVFDTEDARAKHRKSHGISGIQTFKSGQETISGFGIWPCELCPEVFETEDARAKHRKSHVKFGIQTFKYGKETYIYDKDIIDDSNYTKQAPRNTKSKEPYSCIVCGLGFNLASDLLHHRSTHVDGKTCHICGKETSSPNEYKEHMRRHRMEKPSLMYTPNRPQSRRDGADIYEHWTNVFYEAAEYPLKSASPAVSEAHSTGSEPEVIHIDELSQSRSKPQLITIDEPSQSRIKPQVIAVGKTSQSRTGLSDRESFPDANFRFSRSETSSDTLELQPRVEPLRSDTLSENLHTPDTSNPLPLDQHLENGTQPVSFEKLESLDKKGKPHQCTYCPKKFRLELSLRRHMEIHTGEKPYKCEICSGGFATKKVLQTHKKTAHAKVLTCPLCGVKFDPALLNYHMSLHNVYACPKCLNMFDGKEALEYHMRSHQPEEIFTCVVCAETYATFSLLELHLEVHCVPYKPTNKNETNCIDLTVDEPIATGAGEGEHFGTNAGNNFQGEQYDTDTVQDFQGEQFFGTNAGKDLQGEQFGTDKGEEVQEFDYATLQAMPPTNEKPFWCTLCPMAYGSNEPLRNHLKVHSGQRAFMCSECGAGFITEEDLKVHIQVDTRKKPYACSICKKRCTSMILLRRHMRNHKPRLRHPCEHCKKRFRSKIKLHDHIREHCDLESYRYSEPVSINSNVIVNMSNVYSDCDICVRGFENLDDLRIHIIHHLQHHGLSLNRQ